MAIAIPTRQIRARATPRLNREARAGLLFVLPWLIFLVVFTTYPVLGTFALSFTDYSVIEAPEWIGLENYQRMFFQDPSFWTAVKNSTFYAAVSVPLRLVLALLLALVLNLGVRGISAYRVIFYLPALVPPVAATIIFMLMFNLDTGPINVGLRSIGLSPPDWLRDPIWAKPALIILGLWPLGIEVLVFLAGLKEIPQDLLDAAAVDGASRWRRLVGITIPLLTPVILFNLVIGVIYSFQVFTPALIIGDTTGEPLESTLMYMVLIYRNAFRYFSMGYAAAQAMILFAAVAVLTLLIFRSARVWVHYEGGER
jgi:multiple sugar transport system permease protein